MYIAVALAAHMVVTTYAQTTLYYATPWALEFRDAAYERDMQALENLRLHRYINEEWGYTPRARAPPTDDHQRQFDADQDALKRRDLQIYADAEARIVGRLNDRLTVLQGERAAELEFESLKTNVGQDAAFDADIVALDGVYDTSIYKMLYNFKLSDVNAELTDAELTDDMNTIVGKLGEYNSEQIAERVAAINDKFTDGLGDDVDTAEEIVHFLEHYDDFLEHYDDISAWGLAGIVAASLALISWIASMVYFNCRSDAKDKKFSIFGKATTPKKQRRRLVTLEHHNILSAIPQTSFKRVETCAVEALEQETVSNIAFAVTSLVLATLLLGAYFLGRRCKRVKITSNIGQH